MKTYINIPALKPTNLVWYVEISSDYRNEDGTVNIEAYLKDNNLTLRSFYNINCNSFEENDNFEHDDNDVVVKDADITYVEATTNK